MNRIVADEPTFKTDTITLDQDLKSMTYVLTPKFTPAATAPTSNNTKQGARSKAKSPYWQRGKGAKINYNYCFYCG